jgi:hypothetical protein
VLKANQLTSKKIHKSTLTNELNHAVEQMSMRGSNNVGRGERETHVSSEISARIVVFIENNTVVVVARKFGIVTINVRELLEK